MDTTVRICGCKSDYQDRRYGEQKRLHNRCAKEEQGRLGWRCTVCGTKK